MIETDQENLERQKYHMAAVKAWETMRRQKIERIKAEYESVDDYLFDTDMRKVAMGSYKLNPPLIKPSKLTWVEKGGVGKELSDGWSLTLTKGLLSYFKLLCSLHHLPFIPYFNNVM